uniref:DH domain-containing protein n=1 Tax=Meloidogyne javanica TaxID=6303 RepID=A0A915LHA3_MELJA
MIANDSLKIGRNGYTSLRRKSYNLIIPLSPLPIHRSKSQQNVAELSNGALSFIGEAANQIKRGAKGAGSLGAADSADEQRPITSQLAVPSAFHEFPHIVRGTEAVASSSTGTSSEEEARKMVELVERTAVADGDSDLEVETEVPSLESLVGWEVLKHLKPKEKKRQEVINGKTHVRNLKILYKIFYRPMIMQRVASPELIKLLFGNLDELLQVHSEMNSKMRAAVENWQRFGVGNGGGGLYGDIGELIVNLFDGAIGEKLMHNTALFCRNQQHALDTLRQRYSKAKDDPFSQFLSEAENNPLCRKLQLKDMIPVEMQRLVKYPLLLETIAKYTREGSEELQHLLHGIERAKRILSVVNSDKRNAENEKRMEELQQRLDFTGCEKSFFQRFDFRAYVFIF